MRPLNVVLAFAMVAWFIAPVAAPRAHACTCGPTPPDDASVRAAFDRYEGVVIASAGAVNDPPSDYSTAGFVVRRSIKGWASGDILLIRGGPIGSCDYQLSGLESGRDHLLALRRSSDGIVRADLCDSFSLAGDLSPERSGFIAGLEQLAAPPAQTADADDAVHPALVALAIGLPMLALVPGSTLALRRHM